MEHKRSRVDHIDHLYGMMNYRRRKAPKPKPEIPMSVGRVKLRHKRLLGGIDQKWTLWPSGVLFRYVNLQEFRRPGWVYLPEMPRLTCMSGQDSSLSETATFAQIAFRVKVFRIWIGTAQFERLMAFGFSERYQRRAILADYWRFVRKEVRHERWKPGLSLSTISVASK